MDYKFLDEEICLTFVPKTVIKKYVVNETYKKEVLRLYKEKKVVNPLKYHKDLSIKRLSWLKARDKNYLKKYKDNEW